MNTFHNWLQNRVSESNRADEGFFGNLFGGSQAPAATTPGAPAAPQAQPGPAFGTTPGATPGSPRMQKYQQQAQQRQMIYNQLRIYGMKEFQHPQVWSTPDAINQLYDTIGRSQGIIQRIKSQPQVLDKIIEAWWKLTVQGQMPTHM